MSHLDIEPPDRYYRCHGCGKGPYIFEEGELGTCCDPHQESELS